MELSLLYLMFGLFGGFGTILWEDNNMLKTFITRSADGLALGLQGAREEIELEYNMMFNYGVAGPNLGKRTGPWTDFNEAADNFLHWITDDFAYFRTEHKALKNGLKIRFGKEAGAVRREMIEENFLEHDQYFISPFKVSSIPTSYKRHFTLKFL